MWEVVQATLAREFSGSLNLEQWTSLLLRLLIALVLAGIIGYDREVKARSAGLRTHLMVGLGSAMLAVLPQQMGFSDESLARVIQGIVTGIGFLGAGAILKIEDEQRVRGLTTAGSIWATAAVGIAAGLGQEPVAIVTGVFAFVILAWLTRAERRLHPRSDDAPEQSDVSVD